MRPVGGRLSKPLGWRDSSDRACPTASAAPDFPVQPAPVTATGHKLNVPIFSIRPADRVDATSSECHLEEGATSARSGLFSGSPSSGLFHPVSMRRCNDWRQEFVTEYGSWRNNGLKSVSCRGAIRRHAEKPANVPCFERVTDRAAVSLRQSAVRMRCGFGTPGRFRSSVWSGRTHRADQLHSGDG